MAFYQTNVDDQIFHFRTSVIHPLLGISVPSFFVDMCSSTLLFNRVILLCIAAIPSDKVSGNILRPFEHIVKNGVSSPAHSVSNVHFLTNMMHNAINDLFSQGVSKFVSCRLSSTSMSMKPHLSTRSSSHFCQAVLRFCLRRHFCSFYRYDIV